MLEEAATTVQEGYRIVTDYLDEDDPVKVFLPSEL